MPANKNEETPAREEEAEPMEYHLPKRTTNFSSVLMFVLLAVLAGGGFLMYFHNASAASAAGTPITGEQSTVTDFLSSGSDKLSAMGKDLHDTHQLIQQFLVYPAKTQVPLAELRTNPFRKAQGAVRPQESTEAVGRERQDEERAAMLQAVEGLRLQSVITSGMRRSCMINNTLYQEGQQINAFAIEQINPQSVVVRNGMYRFELKKSS